MCKDCETCAIENCRAKTGEIQVERCPWPSWRKEKKNKYDEAFDLYVKKWQEGTYLDFLVKDVFVRACKEAGLK